MGERDINNIADASSFDTEQCRIPALIKVVGVGGGGCNAVDKMFKENIENVTFAVCNTDRQALMNCDVDRKLLLGPNTTHGEGAGDNHEVGRAAANESEDEIRRLFDDETKMVFVTAGMGGGTGTGAGPVVAKVAKEAGMLTIGIVTIPFLFEGSPKIVKALQGAEEMRKYVDSLMIINNERLTEIYADLDLINAFQKSNDTLSKAARSIANIVNDRGEINCDFRDVNTTLKESGTAVVSTGYGEGDKRVTKAIEDALNSPLLKNSDIRSSKRLLFYLYVNPDAQNKLRMGEMSEITEFAGKLSEKIKIKWGYVFDKSLGDKVKMVIIASGFDITISEDKTDTITFRSGSLIEDDMEGHNESTSRSDLEQKKLIERAYGKDKMASHAQSLASSKYVVLKPSQFDDDDTILILEEAAAYNRDPRIREQLLAENAADKRESQAKESAEAVTEPADEDRGAPEGNAPTIVF